MAVRKVLSIDTNLYCVFSRSYTRLHVLSSQYSLLLRSIARQRLRVNRAQTRRCSNAAKIVGIAQRERRALRHHSYRWIVEKHVSTLLTLFRLHGYLLSTESTVGARLRLSGRPEQFFL